MDIQGQITYAIFRAKYNWVCGRSVGFSLLWTAERKEQSALKFKTVIMACDRRVLSPLELELEVENAVNELHEYRNMSDEFSIYSNSDLDPTYEESDATCSSDSDNEPLAKKTKIFMKGLFTKN